MMCCIIAPRRPRRLLVIVNPISGSGNGMKIYQNTAAGIFKQANIETDVIGENICGEINIIDTDVKTMSTCT